MDTHYTTCQKCDHPAMVVVTLDFKPGGTQIFRLCDDHAGYLYLAAVCWYSGKDGVPVPDAKPDLITDTAPLPRSTPR